MHIPDFSKGILVQQTDNFRKKSSESASATTDALGTVQHTHSQPVSAATIPEVSTVAQTNAVQIYLLYTHTEPLGDNGHEKCILLDFWHQ